MCPATEPKIEETAAANLPTHRQKQPQIEDSHSGSSQAHTDLVFPPV